MGHIVLYTWKCDKSWGPETEALAIHRWSFVEGAVRDSKNRLVVTGVFLTVVNIHDRKGTILTLVKLTVQWHKVSEIYHVGQPRRYLFQGAVHHPSSSPSTSSSTP